MNTAQQTTTPTTAATSHSKIEGLTSEQVGNQNSKQQGPDFLALLHEALTEPGRMAECYRLFHRYSLSNAFWIAVQLAGRGEPLAPVASFHRWQELGRQVRKGSRALMMAMPVMIKNKKAAQAQADDPTQPKDEGRRIFVVRRNWFVLTQTDGPEVALEELAPAEWNPSRALAALGIERVDFRHSDGNCQGYAEPQARRLAVSPLAAQPVKTMLHEMAHCLLHTEEARIVDGVELARNRLEVEAESVAYLCCAALAIGDLEASRGYIQGWLGATSAEQITEKHARRILSTADRILKAGRPVEQAEQEVAA